MSIAGIKRTNYRYIEKENDGFIRMNILQMK
jgi:hypothetical protein